MRLAHRLVFAFALFTALALPSRAAAAWTRVTSAHFVFVGDASEREMRDMARRLEVFRDVVGRVFSARATASSVPTTVLVFRDRKSFDPYKPVFQGKPVAIAGLFAGREDANYIAIDAEQDTEAYGVVFHEYAHFLVGNAAGSVPTWLNEGLAQVYQTFELRDGGRSAFLGLLDTNALRVLQTTRTLMPVTELAAVTSSSPLYNEGDRRGLFYAQSWALVHYLSFGAPARAGQLRRYLTSLDEGGAPADAFADAFGDPRQLDKELRDYLAQYAIASIKVVFDQKVVAAALPPAELVSDAEMNGYLGDLLASIRRDDAARELLTRTLASAPDTPRALMALGTMEMRASNDAAAFPLLERAAALAPSSSSIQAAYGRALTRRADKGGADEEAVYRKARTVLARALELDPANPSTIITLAEVEMGLADAPEHAVLLVRRAMEAAPGREEYRLMLGQALAMSGDFRRARTELASLAARAVRMDIRDAATTALERVTAAETMARREAQRIAERKYAADTDAPVPPSADDAPRRADYPQGTFEPTLRSVQAGEARVLGTFAAVDCRPGVIVLQIDTASGPLRAAVKTFDEVEFLTYRPDSPTSVPCGAQRPAYRVLATYRTDRALPPAAGTANRAVAIELLPDGFAPK